ncbi:zf-U1-domain-containing protein [Testicularia cyperi]|uniref:Zf-U1-domain-containing protein n=1 Tax=Testicularia cyperi TaxID=1882483 RepID=A0A317XZZ9_9BASI|nr:zf-U1-domain-containing protein [Testicularia cyperi]
MGKHYCDYCDVFLTHDSVSVRKAHNSGRNHLQNVREYYQNLDPAEVEKVINTLAQEYDRRGIEKPRDLLHPVGSSFMTFGSGPLSGGGGNGGGGSDRRDRSSLLTFGSGPLSGNQDRSYQSRGGRGDSSGGGGSGGHGGYSRNGPPLQGTHQNDTRGAPPNFSRPPSSGPYSRPPPGMGNAGSHAGGYNRGGPPSGYGAGPGTPQGGYDSSRMPPSNYSSQRSGYGPR